jgi:hypothetical protein
MHHLIMKKTVKAKISWIPASAGGRKRLPRGPIYSTVASFEDDEDDKAN